MKNIKYLFLLLIVVLLSGCSVKYDLNIDNDLSVTEKIEASEREDVIKAKTGVNSDKVVNYLYDIFKRENIEPSISSKIESDNLIGYATVSHDSIDDYVDNFSSDIFEKASLSKSDNIYSLTFKQTEKLSSELSTSPIYDKVTVNITLPFKVVENNADKVYKNTYTWEIKSEEELRKIKIKFDISNKDNTKTFNLGFLKVNVNYGILVTIGLLLIISGIIFLVYLNNKKNNKF